MFEYILFIKAISPKKPLFTHTVWNTIRTQNIYTHDCVNKNIYNLIIIIFKENHFLWQHYASYAEII